MFKEWASRRVITLFCSIVFSLVFFGLTRMSNGWLYLVPAIVGPLLGALFVLLRPLNPYESLFANLEHMNREDKRSDWPGNRLVEVLASGAAKRLAIRTGVMTSLVLGGVAFGISWLSKNVAWSLDVGAVAVVTVVFAIFSLGIQYHVLLRWAFRSWDVQGR